MKIEIWKKNIIVALMLRARIDGGIPQSKELIAAWIRSKNKAASEEEIQALVNSTIEDLGDKVEEGSKALWTTFKKDKTGIYYEGRCAKAAFKEASNVIKDMLAKAYEKAHPKAKRNKYTNLRSRVAERLFVEEDRLYFYRDGKILADVDGNEERPIHVMTALGPRTALKKCDYVLGKDNDKPTEIRMTLRVLNDGLVDRDLLEMLIEYMAENGLGANRSQGMGKFDLLKLEGDLALESSDEAPAILKPTKKKGGKVVDADGDEVDEEQQ